MVFPNIKRIFGFSPENQTYNLQIVADNFVDTISRSIKKGKTLNQSLWQFDKVEYNEDGHIQGRKDYAGFEVTAAIYPVDNNSYEVIVTVSNDKFIEMSGNIIRST